MKDTSILTNNGVNVAQSLELFGDMEMYDETLNDFLSMVQEKLDKLDKYKLASDMPNYAIEVHSLKSDARYLGFTNLADLSYQSEMKSKAGDIMFVQDNHPKIMDEAKKMIDISKQYMGMATAAKPASSEPQVYIPVTGISATGGNPDNPQKLQTVITNSVVENTSDPMAQVLSEAVNTQVVPVTQAATETTPETTIQFFNPTTETQSPVAPTPQPINNQPAAMPQPAPQYYTPATQPVAMPQPTPQYYTPAAQPVAMPEPTPQYYTPPAQPVAAPVSSQTIQFLTPDPMTQALASQMPAQEPAQPTVTTGPKEGTILVVDDSNLVANFVKKIFDAKYDVIIANDGAKAIELVSNPEIRSKVKACLLDLNMPNVSGYDVLENFKQTGVFVKMPVAVVSGVEDMESIDKVNNYPIVDILSKPFNERDVQRVVEKCLATYF